MLFRCDALIKDKAYEIISFKEWSFDDSVYFNNLKEIWDYWYVASPDYVDYVSGSGFSRMVGRAIQYTDDGQKVVWMIMGPTEESCKRCFVADLQIACGITDFVHVDSIDISEVP